MPILSFQKAAGDMWINSRLPYMCVVCMRNPAARVMNTIIFPSLSHFRRSTKRKLKPESNPKEHTKTEYICAHVSGTNPTALYDARIFINSKFKQPQPSALSLKKYIAPQFSPGLPTAPSTVWGPMAARILYRCCSWRDACTESFPAPRLPNPGQGRTSKVLWID
jgi:hypothetical protein